MVRYVRILLAIVICPLVLALAESLLAIGTDAFLPLLILSWITNFALFLFCGAVCHFLLRILGWTTLRQYFGVMLGVGSVVLFAVSVTLLLATFGQGGSEYHFRTQVIDKGSFTVAGLILTALESVFRALWLAASFCLFWYITRSSRHAQYDA